MRKFIPAIIVLSLLAFTARAGEKSAFLNGVFSVAAPDGWHAAMDQNEHSLSIIAPGSGVTRVAFSTPNVNAKGNVPIVSEKNLDMMYMFFGDGLEIEDEDENAVIGDKKGYKTLFTAELGQTVFRGQTFVFAHGDYVVVSLGMSTKDDFDKYEATINDVVASYQINPQALADNAALLQRLSDETERKYKDMMAEMEALELEDETEGQPIGAK